MSIERSAFVDFRSLLTGLIIVLAVFSRGGTAMASEAAERSDTESYVLEQVAAGNVALLAEKFPIEGRTLRGTFVRELLTNPDKRISVHPHGIMIEDAVILGAIDLKNEDVPYDVILRHCQCD